MGLDVPDDFVKERDAGVAVVEDHDGGYRGSKVRDGRKVGGEVDADGEGNEEGPTEEEHLVTAQMPARHSHGNEEHHARCHQSQLDRSEHHLGY